MPRTRLVLEDDNGLPLTEADQQVYALALLKIAALNGQWQQLWQPACPA